MENRFNKDHANQLISQYPDIAEELVRRIYTSRLIGTDADLVLPGGGSTSLKLRQKNLIGEDQDILYVNGGGLDLANIEPEGFVALDLAVLRKFRRLDAIEDTEMANQLQIHRLQASSLNPSVESFLHAFLPHRYIDHTHADSILALTNQPNGKHLVQELFGPRVAVLPYVMSQLGLAKTAAAKCDTHPDLEAIVIVNHGIFSFGEDAETSYTRMIDCVQRAETYIKRKSPIKPPVSRWTNKITSEERKSWAAVLAPLIRGACAYESTDGRLCRFMVEFRHVPELLGAVHSEDAQCLCESGVLTPGHARWTKNRYVYIGSLPDRVEKSRALLTPKIDEFVKKYQRYVKEHHRSKAPEYDRLDPYPRVFVVQGLGLFTLGASHQEAKLAADIAEHTIRAKQQAEAIGAYIPIADANVFKLENGCLQQTKATKLSPSLLQGQIAVITGGGGAIGFGIADRLLAAGAAVVLSDIDESRLQKVYVILKDRYPKGEIKRIPFDVADYPSVSSAYEEISRMLGGIDIVVPNAGVAHVAKIEDLDSRQLDLAINVNFKGTVNTIKAAIPVFKRQGYGGNVVVISTKNVFDPGAAFGAYSATKAGAHQIAKIAALELAPLGIRVNMVNPDAVFGDQNISSNLWEMIGPDRMKSRGLNYEGLQEYYHNRNLLKAKIKAEHVGNAVVFFASNQTPTTGASLPVDGGIPAAFPR